MLPSLSNLSESHSSPPPAGQLGEPGQEQLSSPPREQATAVFLGGGLLSLFSAWGKPFRLVLIVGLLLLFFWIGWSVGAKPDPYTEAVLKLSGEVSHGASLFALNCAACHGEEADGRVGPSLRGISRRRSDRFIIQQVTSGRTPPMPQFQPDPQEMADLLSYLKTL